MGKPDYPRLSQNKRRYVRFPAMCRVEYTIDGRSTFVFTQDLSPGGMQLRSVKQLETGQTLTFQLHLFEGQQPVSVDGAVQRLSQGTAGVTFQPDQERAFSAIHTFIDQRLLSRAAEKVSATGGSAAQVADLAMYYLEVGRLDDALALYRKSLEKRSQELALYEQMATLLLYRVEQGGSESGAFLNELELLITRGLANQKSRTLDSIRQELEPLRKRMIQRENEDKRREREVLLKDAQAQAQQAIDRAVKSKVAVIEREFEAKLAGSDIGAERKTLVKDQAKLAKDQRTLAAAQQKLTRAEEVLRTKTKAFEAQLKVAETKQRELDRREHELSLRKEALASMEAVGKLIDRLNSAAQAIRSR